MSTERKMIGLPTQALFVPPVPIDYGTRGTPSLVVKTTKGTNRTKSEPDKKKAHFIEYQVLQKAGSKDRTGRSGLHLDSADHTRHEIHSSPLVPKQISNSRAEIRSLPTASISYSVHFTGDIQIEPHSFHHCQPKKDSNSPRWQHPPPSSSRPPEYCLSGPSSNPILKFNIIKQAESHPTGFLIDNPEEKLSSSYQFKYRAHLLHRTMEKYHE